VNIEYVFSFVVAIIFSPLLMFFLWAIITIELRVNMDYWRNKGKELEADLISATHRGESELVLLNIEAERLAHQVMKPNIPWWGIGIK
jgi:hypothetical protein